MSVGKTRWGKEQCALSGRDTFPLEEKLGFSPVVDIIQIDDDKQQSVAVLIAVVLTVKDMVTLMRQSLLHLDATHAMCAKYLKHRVPQNIFWIGVLPKRIVEFRH